jgi:KDO2-lipid IV(A) lauroyltransferase
VPRLGHRIEFLALQAAAGLVRASSIERASDLMGRLWERVGPRTSRHSRVAANLALAMPETSNDERRRISAEQWNNLGRTFAESLLLERIAAEPWRCELNVADELDRKLLGPGQGAVFVSCHAANWEAAGLALRRYGPPMALYQPLSNPLSERFIRALRENSFTGGMVPKGVETPGRVMRWVRAGGTIAMLADLYEKRGIPVSFFGQPTLANPFPAMVARRLGVPLVAVRITRLPGVRFRLELDEFAMPVSASFAADVRTATQTMFDRFEAWIRDRPGEWMWVQRRWRTKKGNDAPAAVR